LIRSRQRLFGLARQLTHSRDLSRGDAAIVARIATAGFLNVHRDGQIAIRFGHEALESRLSQFILDLATQAGVLAPKRARTRIRPARVVEESESGPQPIPALPIQVSKSFSVIELGTIVTDRSGWRSGRYVYPAGFVSERLSASVIDQREKALYRSLVIETGEGGPLFRVEMRDKPEIRFDGSAPSRCWCELKRETMNRRRQLGLLGNGQAALRKEAQCSGPLYFGFSDETVARLIQSLPGADHVTIDD
jgi:chromodomain-helicase-DNA-binding protein 7